MAPEDPLTGADGELVERLVALLDRSPEDNPSWWYEYGLMVGLRIGVALPAQYTHRTVPQQVLIDCIRSQALDVIEEIDEAFLVRSLRRDLDEFAERSGDTRSYDAQVQAFRDHQQQVIDDPQVRAEWRDRMMMARPEYASMTDDEMVADARRTLQTHPMAQPTDADEAAWRWATSQAWLAASNALLGDDLIQHWTSLNIRQMND